MKFRRISGALGAEITGIDLTQDLSADLAKDIRGIFLNHNVIFLKNQSSIKKLTSESCPLNIRRRLNS
jgi:taurine dioxygenase